ncbi:hypothetical protein CASFOL_016177 [Castilleja foliolosa]|uniref:Uncharacterized protein n=1 Tax=Castilleja foliolosa TaxID=1961234 RepID=A0ABD3DJB8_9LAMI
MEEYNQTKNEAISKNAATVTTEEGIGSNKDNEPEPKRVTTRVLEPDFEIPNKVPNLVKKPNVEKSRTDEKVQAEVEKRSSHRSDNGGDDKNSEIEKLLARKSKKVVFKEYSNEEDKEEREEIEKSPSREFGNFAMEKSKSKRVDSDIEKLSSRRSGKVADEGVGIKKCPAYQSRDEYKREEIEKNSSQQFRNVIMQKSKNDKARADISKSSSRCSMIFIDKEYSSVDEDEQGKKDERVEIEKHSSHEFRNVTTKKLKKQNAEPDFVQRSCRQSRKVVYKDYSSHEDEDENVDLRIKKRPARQSREAVMDNSSDNGNTVIKKHSSHKFRKNEEEKLTTEMDARAAREYRKVVMKRPRGKEDVEEEVKRFRDFLLMRSRYEVEEDNTNNRVGESSVRHNKINEDSSEEDEKSSDKDSDVEILSIDESLKGPFVPSTTFRNTDVRNYRLSDEYIEFRRQALEVISKPYDKSEYKDLFAEFKGRCYPGYHQDLVEKLKENRWNPRKRLAILRGFFFWLQNLTRVGSFKPWHDDVCLRVEPVRLPKNNGPW